MRFRTVRFPCNVSITERESRALWRAGENGISSIELDVINDLVVFELADGSLVYVQAIPGTVYNGQGDQS